MTVYWSHHVGIPIKDPHGSFFVSRVDTEIDKRLDATTSGPGTDSALKGKAGVANARLAYQAYEEVFSSGRWRALEAIEVRCALEVIDLADPGLQLHTAALLDHVRGLVCGERQLGALSQGRGQRLG